MTIRLSPQPPHTCYSAEFVVHRNAEPHGSCDDHDCASYTLTIRSIPVENVEFLDSVVGELKAQLARHADTPADNIQLVKWSADTYGPNGRLRFHC